MTLCISNNFSKYIWKTLFILEDINYLYGRLCWQNKLTSHTQFKEHAYKHNQPVHAHFDKCTCSSPTLNGVKIFASTSPSLNFILTLEALHIREIKPKINTKESTAARN